MTGPNQHVQPESVQPESREASREASPPKSQEALRAEIAELRADLGDTVEALAARADVKAQLSAKAEETKAQVRERVEHGTTLVRQAADQGAARAKAEVARGRGVVARYSPWPQVAAAALAVAFVTVLGGRQLARRRRRR
jgi:ElaB/YqjD/DUF883 family membrane-anchored ribosome-binding protein